MLVLKHNDRFFPQIRSSTYSVVCNGLTDCANAAIGCKKFKPFLKPYWKHELSKQHSMMRRRQAEWCRNGRRAGESTPRIDTKDCKRGFRRLLRMASITHMNSLNADIDNSAEKNSNSVTKRRSVYNKNSTGPGIVFNGTDYRDQRAITEQWGAYFQNLYSPATCANYDDNWYGHVTNTINQKNTLKTDSTATVLPPQGPLRRTGRHHEWTA